MPEMIRRTLSMTAEPLGPRQVRLRASTEQLGRDDLIVVTRGMDLAPYRTNPVMLWQHQPEMPVARASEVAIAADELQVLADFAPEGVSPKADEICGLVKAGIVSGISCGFAIREAEAINPKDRSAGVRVKSSELMEISFVSIPAVRDAVVTQRAKKEADWKVGAARGLPIEDSDAWDGAAAEASIFEHAGGDDFDPAKAKRGFLAYDAANSKERGSYKLPIAHVVDGELKVPKGAIRAAASRVSQADLPQDVKDEAQKVIDAYEKKAGMGEDADRAAAVAAMVKRSIDTLAELAAVTPEKKRGLWDAACLLMTVGDLYYAASNARWESEMEGDESPVPAALKEAADAVAKVALDYVTEELTEAAEVGRAFQAATRRAGKTHSAATIDTINAAIEHGTTAIEHATRCIDTLRGMVDDGGDSGGSYEASAKEFSKRQHDIRRLAVSA